MSQLHELDLLILLLCCLLLRRFEALLQAGKSPTCELLFDWGTTNCTVGDLVDLLIQNEFFAPASLLLPGKLSVSRCRLFSEKARGGRRDISGFIVEVLAFRNPFAGPTSPSTPAWAAMNSAALWGSLAVELCPTRKVVLCWWKVQKDVGLRYLVQTVGR